MKITFDSSHVSNIGILPITGDWLTIDLTGEFCFILTKSNLLRYKIYNSFSHKVERFVLLGIYLFH